MGLFSAIAAVAFAAYAPSISFVLFHDDIVIWLHLAQRTALNIFESRATDDLYRPLTYALWILVRDGFGQAPAILHFFNVALHILNTLLVGMLALRLGKSFGVRGLLFPALCALIFALFPFSYQSVQWASAIVHPLMTCLGLFGVHAYWAARTARQPRQRWLWLAASLVFVLAACFAHEMGFLFGLLIAWIELVLLVLAVKHRRLFWPAAWPALLGIAYVLAFRTLGQSTWASAKPLNALFADFAPNMLHFMQGFIAWLVILLRGQIGLIAQINTVIVLVFGLGLAVGLLVMGRARLSLIGLLGLGVWFIGSAPPAAALAADYVVVAPRLQYLSSIGIALFWAGFGLACQRLLRPRAAFVPVLVLMGGLFGWCLVYICGYTEQTHLFSVALRVVGDDVRKIAEDRPNPRVLLINPPAWVASNYVRFWLGNDGIPLWPDYITPDAYLFSTAEFITPITLVHHTVSLTQNPTWQYGIAGEPVDDTQLRAKIAQADLVYRFDYDEAGVAGGITARQLGTIEQLQPVAVFRQDQARVFIEAAKAVRCGSAIGLELTWVIATPPAQSVGVFVHGFNAAGEQILVADNDLLAGYWPLSDVPGRFRLTETRALNLNESGEANDANTIHAITEIRLGLYNRETQQRLPALRADRSQWMGDEAVIPISAGACPLP
jgi:hypothetical protein